MATACSAGRAGFATKASGSRASGTVIARRAGGRNRNRRPMAEGRARFRQKLVPSKRDVTPPVCPTGLLTAERWLSPAATGMSRLAVTATRRAMYRRWSHSTTD